MDQYSEKIGNQRFNVIFGPDPNSGTFVNARDARGADRTWTDADATGVEGSVNGGIEIHLPATKIAPGSTFGMTLTVLNVSGDGSTTCARFGIVNDRAAYPLVRYEVATQPGQALFDIQSVINILEESDWYAPLSGDESVPPAATDAYGVAVIKQADAGNALEYSLQAFSENPFVAAFLQCAPGADAENVGVTLYQGPPLVVWGALASGVVTAPDPGNACWEELDDVVAALNEGRAFVVIVAAGDLSIRLTGKTDVYLPIVLK